MAPRRPNWRCGAHVVVRWWHGGACVARPRRREWRRRGDRGSPVLQCTAAGGEGMRREWRTQRSWCAHPHYEEKTETAGGEEEAAARLQLTVK